MTRWIERAALLVAAAAVLAPGASAQSAEEVVDRMLAAYEERVRLVENYSIVQELMGFRSEMYFEKEVRDGHTVFELRATTNEDGSQIAQAEDIGFSDLYANAPDLAEHARYGGTESLGASEVHVLLLDDVAALDMDVSSAAGEAGFVPRTGRLLVDAERLVPLRMEFTGDVDTPRGPVEVTSRIDLEDYREVEDMLVPFRTVVRVEGIAAAMDPDARAQLDEMRAQLESLPESQRAMVEEMMGGQLEQMEAMLSDDAMTIEMMVVEVRVNEGPPS